jgi:hypothetical protein
LKESRSGRRIAFVGKVPPLLLQAICTPGVLVVQRNFGCIYFRNLNFSSMIWAWHFWKGFWFFLMGFWCWVCEANDQAGIMSCSITASNYSSGARSGCSCWVWHTIVWVNYILKEQGYLSMQEFDSQNFRGLWDLWSLNVDECFKCRTCGDQFLSSGQFQLYIDRQGGRRTASFLWGSLVTLRQTVQRWEKS